VNFAPSPKNDFAEFIEAYFERCRQRIPEIEVNAGKWTFEDLIPGLSDFDTRFLVHDDTTAAGWCRMSTEVGRVHLELAMERKEWARNLEHLPGVNLKLNEFFDPHQYFTEFSQWSFYHGRKALLDKARWYATSHKWTATDEGYHWKKIAIYYGPYNRAIDPPINLGSYQNKYPLHSRLMHYMAPPVHSAVCLMQKKTSPGKLEAFRKARDLFPQRKKMDLILELIGRHYEAPDLLAEPDLTNLDHRLADCLTGVVNVLLSVFPLPNCPGSPTIQQLKNAVHDLSGADPLARLFENIKFARLMKGRLWF